MTDLSSLLSTDLQSPLTSADAKPATELWSLCVECGPNVTCDEDGCCAMCGGTAVGTWLDASQGRKTPAIDGVIDKLRSQLQTLTAENERMRGEVDRLNKYIEHNDEEYRAMKDVLRAEHAEVERMRPVYEAVRAYVTAARSKANLSPVLYSELARPFDAAEDATKGSP